MDQFTARDRFYDLHGRMPNESELLAMTRLPTVIMQDQEAPIAVTFAAPHQCGREALIDRQRAQTRLESTTAYEWTICQDATIDTARGRLTSGAEVRPEDVGGIGGLTRLMNKQVVFHTDLEIAEGRKGLDTARYVVRVPGGGSILCSRSKRIVASGLPIDPEKDLGEDPVPERRDDSGKLWHARPGITVEESLRQLIARGLVVDLGEPPAPAAPAALPAPTPATGATRRAHAAP